MKAYVFPGQGAQQVGMGKELYESSEAARKLFRTADEILGFGITDIMFNSTDEELRMTRVTQPAIFIHSVILAKCLGEEFRPSMVAGHSLGEFSALAAVDAIGFEDGLRLVAIRANAMQRACEATESTMAAILALDEKVIEEVCAETPGIVIAANYNCPGQTVISGEVAAVDTACERLKALGAKRAMRLKVSGAFHSPLMESARSELQAAIEQTPFSAPLCPVYQNVDARPHTNPDEIRKNLISQLTSPVLWRQSIVNMHEDGADVFEELGPGKVLQGLITKTVPGIQAASRSRLDQ